MNQPEKPALPTAARTASEAMMLLAELGRVLKGRSFYGPGDPNLAKLFARAVRAWQTDLERHGPFEVRVAAEGLRVPDVPGGLDGQFSGLVRTLAGRGVERLRIEPGIDAEAFAGLVEVLVADRTRLAAEGGIARALYAFVPDGVRVNGIEPARPEPPAPRWVPAPPARRPESPAKPSVAPLPGGALGDEDTQSLPNPGWLESSAAAAGAAPADEDFDSHFPLTSGGGLDFGAEPLETGDGTDPLELDADEAASPYPDDAPTEPFLDVPSFSPAESAQDEPAGDGAVAADEEAAEDPTPEALHEEILAELEAAGEDFGYRDLVDRATASAEQLVEERRPDLAFHILVALTEHAGDGDKRPPLQRQTAGDAVTRLAAGACLQELITRASAGGDDSLRASEILTGLRGEAAPALLRAAERERSAEQRTRLHGLLIALGEEALPALDHAMEDASPARVRAATRLAGEIQHPGIIPRLARLLDHENASLGQEAAKALLRIPGPRAVDALVEALSSSLDHVPPIAMQALGQSDSERAEAALLEALRSTEQRGDMPAAREAIRALGRLGRPGAVPELAAILLRRGFFQRRRQRELKLAAASALGRMPGDEAVGALAQAAQSGDTQIRRAAQIALERRAHALAGR